MTQASPTSTVYLETTIASYLTAWPSRDLLVATQQQLTKEWWRDAHRRYDLFISQTVIDETARGDPSAAQARIDVLKDVGVLEDDPAVEQLAGEYVKLLALPPKAEPDAIHLANAVVFELDYLVTWNMRHLANSLTMRRITEYNRDRALWIPLLVTPQYLLDIREREQV